MRGVSAVRPEREARRGREHPRHVRPPRARRVRPVPASRNYKTVPRARVQGEALGGERLRVQAVPHGGVPEAQARERALLRGRVEAPDRRRWRRREEKRRQSLDVREGEGRPSRGGRGGRAYYGGLRAHPREHPLGPLGTYRDAHAHPGEVCAQCGRSFPHLARSSRTRAEHTTPRAPARRDGGGPRRVRVAARFRTCALVSTSSARTSGNVTRDSVA